MTIGRAIGPTRAELTTLSDSGAVFHWAVLDRAAPDPDDPFGRPRRVAVEAAITYGANPDPRTWQIAPAEAADERGGYYRCALDGLRPGTPYFYRILTNGRPHDEATVDAPGSFRTLATPPGPELGRIAVISDLHLTVAPDPDLTRDRDWSGTGDPLRTAPGRDPVGEMFADAERLAGLALGQIAAEGADLILALGDLSQSGYEEELARAAALFAAGPIPVHATIGNHDCRRPAGRPPGRETFARLFPGPLDRSFDHGGHHLVLLDSCHPEAREGDPLSHWGRLTAAQLDWLDADLAATTRPALIFLHHPTNGEASHAYGLLGDTLPFQRVLARHADVAGVFGGHMHRCRAGVAALTGAVPYVEVPSTMQYPLAYTRLRLHAGGYLLTTHRVPDPHTAEWSRDLLLNVGPLAMLGGHDTLGRLEERNFSRGVG